MAENHNIYNARDDLQWQVDQGYISQAQADAELMRRIREGYGITPELQESWNNLQGQVDAGHIKPDAMFGELNRLVGIGYGEPGRSVDPVSGEETSGGTQPGPSGAPGSQSGLGGTENTANAAAAVSAGGVDPSLSWDAFNTLNNAVGQNGFTQDQANAEYWRLLNLQGVTSPLSPLNLFYEEQRLNQMVDSGEMTREQADSALHEIKISAQAPYVSPGLLLNNSPQLINTIFDAARASQMYGNMYTNPNQINAFGSSMMTIDPVTGQPTVTQNLSEGNQGVVGGLQKGGMGALGALQNVLGGGSIFASLANAAQGKDSSSPLSNFEQAHFDRLTDTYDEQRTKDREMLDQKLANRGIPINSELYNDQQAQLEKRYDDMFQAARDQAVQAGTQSSMQALGTLTGVGQAGFFNPQFQGFQAVGYQQPDINSIFNSVQNAQQWQDQFGLQQQQFDWKKYLEEQALARQNAASSGGGGGGGGSSSGPAPVNPFVNSLPPGY